MTRRLHTHPDFRRRGFTLIEVLVGVAVAALLLGIMTPVLGRAVETARIARGAANLRTIGAATTSHSIDHRGALPQVWVEIGEGGFVLDVYAFGGVRGSLDELSVRELDERSRPLNRYIDGDAESVFHDPLDSGAEAALPLVHAARTDSMFDLVGTSYILNDHALDGVPCPYAPTMRTLIPGRDKPAPEVRSPARTWLAGDHGIYNYDGGADAGIRWRRGSKVIASLAFVDGHVTTGNIVPEGAHNTTPDYTFLPRPDWSSATQ